MSTSKSSDNSFEILGKNNKTVIRYSCLTKETKFIFKSDDEVISKMKKSCLTFNDITKSYKGDVNLGLRKSYFCGSKQANALPLVRGAQLSKYGYEAGEEYCLKDALSKDETMKERIVLQEVANMGQDQRIKATILQNVICGDSCNLLYSKDEKISNYVVLAVLNSKAVNYYFKYFNQTNHVPVGELRKIPFPNVSDRYKNKLQMFVEKVFEMSSQDAKNHIMLKIDFLVYHLYGLTYDEVLVVDPDTLITREEYEAYK